MFTTAYALNASAGFQTNISDGSRTTLGKGNAVTFTNLPNQPVAIVVYNNTGNTTPFNVAYANQKPQNYSVQSVQGQGFSLGLAYIIDPSVTKAFEITVSVPDQAQQNSSVDVYAVSLYLPLSGINNVAIPTNGSSVTFSGYSRAYATPGLAWYDLNINSTHTGQVGLLFDGSTIEVIGVNMPSTASAALKSVIINTTGSGVPDGNISVTVESGGVYANTIFGTSSQIVYSPVSPTNTASDGSISLQKIS
ncbi:Uncharacterised protein [Yersinia aldovae]|uniref:hypothetical protein n=1 Tax=Yersinia aldovae TaxID=29483 RepID=UPI0005DBE7B8|nr:hypothetical protein [Yersinia aldovae]CNH52216.1 Uncharacterised protein [Yersinia aldovae]